MPVVFEDTNIQKKLALLEAQPRMRLDKDVTDELCNLLSNGVHLTTACAVIGISTTMVEQWVRYGLHIDTTSHDTLALYEAFTTQLFAATALSETKVLHKILERGHGNVIASEDITQNEDGTTTRHVQYRPPAWQALSWYLERKSPSRWGKVTKIEAEIVPAELKDADLDKKLVELLTTHTKQIDKVDTKG